MILALLVHVYLWCSIGTVIALQKEINRIGRWNNSFADWSTTSLRMTVLATKNENPRVELLLNSLELCSKCNYFLQVAVDCKDTKRFQVSNSTMSISFELELMSRNSIFEVSITKITEPNTGTWMVQDIEISNGELLNYADSCQHLRRKMIVIGDSLNIGYGVEGESPCPYSPDTENVLLAYGHLTAHRLSSEVHVIAWSGRGVVRNYGENETSSKSLTVPQLYNRTLASSELDLVSYWDPANFQASVVMIDLGTNDYSTEPHPSDEEFSNGLSAFVGTVQKDYPTAQVLLICSYNLTDSQCGNIEAVAESKEVHFLRLDKALVSSLGCNYHPDQAAQQAISDFVTPFVESLFVAHEN